LKNTEEGDQISASDPVEDKDTNVAGGDDVNRDSTIAAPSKGMSEYKRNRAKNIAHLKQELAKLEEQYPTPEEFQ